jgi:hypothetical protein
MTLNTILEQNLERSSEHACWTKIKEIYDRQKNFTCTLYPSNNGTVGSHIAPKILMIYVWLLICFYCFVSFDELTDSPSKESHKISEDVKDKSYSEKYILNTTENNFTLSFVPTKSVI